MDFWETCISKSYSQQSRMVFRVWQVVNRNNRSEQEEEYIPRSYEVLHPSIHGVSPSGFWTAIRTAGGTDTVNMLVVCARRSAKSGVHGLDPGNREGVE